MDTQHIVLGILGVSSVIGIIAASLSMNKAFKEGKVHVVGIVTNSCDRGMGGGLPKGTQCRCICLHTVHPVANHFVGCPEYRNG